MVIHLINIVRSDGYADGTESLPLHSTDLDYLVAMIYRIYQADYRNAKDENDLEDGEELKSFEEYEKSLLKKKGNLVVLQMRNSHIQYEYSTITI